MMKRTWKSGLLILPVALACTCIQAVAQEGEGRTVTGTGAVNCANATLHLVGTLGQPIIGTAVTRHQYVAEGFWHNTSQKGVGSPGLPVPGKASAIMRCSPNPIAKSGTIEVNLEQSDHVTLSLHDLLGREVRTLTDEPKDAGSFSVELNAEEIASGRYTLRLTVGNANQTLPLIIAR